MTEGAAGMSAGKKGNTANQAQQREQDFPGNTTFHMSKRQVLAGLQLYCSNPMTVILLQRVNKIVLKVKFLLLNKKKWKTGEYKQNGLYFTKLDEFNIVTGWLVITEIH